MIGPNSSLGRGALALRGVHVLIAAGEIASLICLWTCAITGRRGRALNAALVMLSTEGVGLVAGRGDCPLGPLQQRVGDPVPLFEFVLSPRAAKRAVPALAGVTLMGMVVLIVRGQHRDTPSPEGRCRLGSPHSRPGQSPLDRPQLEAGC